MAKPSSTRTAGWASMRGVVPRCGQVAVRSVKGRRGQVVTRPDRLGEHAWAMSLWTATDAATCAAQALGGESGQRSDAFRCVLQLLDDYTRAIRDAGSAAGIALFQDPPPPTGDSGVDAAIAALAEHLARRDGWQPPSWAFDERRYAEPWWFVSGVRAWHAIALVESPLAFRKRGVFLTSSALERV